MLYMTKNALSSPVQTHPHRHPSCFSPVICPIVFFFFFLYRPKNCVGWKFEMVFFFSVVSRGNKQKYIILY